MRFSGTDAGMVVVAISSSVHRRVKCILDYREIEKALRIVVVVVVVVVQERGKQEYRRYSESSLCARVASDSDRRL